MFEKPAVYDYPQDFYTPHGGMTEVVNHMSRLIPRSKIFMNSQVEEITLKTD